VNREPVAIVAAVEAVLAVAIAFGLDVTAEQLGLIVAALTAVLALFVRSRVTPVS
jgi:hypothetical protein